MPVDGGLVMAYFMSAANNFNLTPGTFVGGAAIFWLLVVLAASLYLLPSLMVLFRRHHLAAAVVFVNLFLGWTVVWWFVGFFVACTTPERLRRATPVANAPAYSYR